MGRTRAGSTWASGMSSSRIHRWALVAVLGLTALRFSRGETMGESFAASYFNPLPPAVDIPVRGSQAGTIRDILGRPYDRKTIRCWRAANTAVWILEARAKSGRITAGFALRDGRLERVKVLEYRGQHGRDVQSGSFTRQFDGAGLSSDRQLDRSIDGISGATISVRTLVHMARLALVLEAESRASDGSPAGP